MPVQPENAENPVTPKLPKAGIKGFSGYIADVTTANELKVNIGGTAVITATLLSEGAIGAPIPADGILVAGENPSGNIEPLQVDTNNELITSSIGLALNATNQISVTSSGVLIIAANAARAGVIITNPSATLTVYIGTSGVTTGNGFPLGPGANVTLPVVSDVYGITSSTSVTVGYLEVV
jgi:hypothetical protein